MHYLAMNTRLMQKALQNDDSLLLYPDSAPSEGVDRAKGWLQDWRRHENLLRHHPEMFTRLCYHTAKEEINHHEGELFNPEIYVSATVKDELGAHTTPWRMALRTPTFANVQVLEAVLPGTQVDDVEATIASLGWTLGDLDK